MKVLLLAVALGSMLAGPAWSQKKPDKPTTSTPMVVDSAGQVVGRYTYGPGGPAVLMDYNGKVILLPLVYNISPLLWNEFNSIYFTSNNCSGPGYIVPNGPTGIGAVIDERTPIRAFVQSGNPLPVNFQSRLLGSFCEVTAGSLSLAPTSTMRLPLPPFYLR